MSYLGRSSVIWHCCKCDSINVDSFKLISFELYISNVFAPLSGVDTSLDSITSSCFSPLHTSSPWSTTPRSLDFAIVHQQPRACIPPICRKLHPPEMKSPLDQQTGVYWLTVNCCGIRTNRAEFNAANEYVKPDLICGTESWLRGIKVRKRANIRNRYNQAPHLTQDTNGKMTTLQLDITNGSQEASPFPAGDHKASTNRRA